MQSDGIPNSFWESLFPWLSDFKEVPVQEAWLYKDTKYEKDYDFAKNWISPVEYQKLSSEKRNQLSLDRYRKRKKSNWEAGIEYERYVGYLLEKDGWIVEYRGALLGLEDMGVDLVATKNKANIAVQCKRWSSWKTIHENSICQLLGSAAAMSVSSKSKTYSPVFICTCPMSETAKKIADYLNVKCVELPVTNSTLETYPCIKCNIGKDGSKIYHLPFDQQYDKISISNKKGAIFAATVKEAEEKGFRRAYRWTGNKESSS